MIRVTHEFFCDICGEPDGKLTINVHTGQVYPQPGGGQPVFNNVALCGTCAALAVPAMNEALKDRFATETSNG